MLRRGDARVKLPWRECSPRPRRDMGRRNRLASAACPSGHLLSKLNTSATSALRPRPSLAPRLYGAVTALAALAGLALWLWMYPLDKWVAGTLLAAWVALVIARPGSWLVALPALWPVIDLAPWTGQIYFTESDALALATLLALGLRETLSPPAPTLSGRAPVKLNVAALTLFGLLAGSVLASGLRGLLPLPALEPEALINYSSTLNALRVGKGFGLAFALIPFLHLAIRRDGELALTRFTTGLTLGLASCALAALWERLAFPGFTNFSSDYRSTALFWEMHVGGATLDAWLMLSFPFALANLLAARSPLARGLALVAVGLGGYAIFTTFSRIVFGALLVVMAVLGGMALLRPATSRPTETPRGHPGVLLALGGGVLAGCFLAFGGGGYRGMLAFAGLALLAYQAGGVLAGARAGQLIAGALAGIMLMVASLLATAWVPKGAYLIYALSWSATAIMLWQAGRSGIKPAVALVTALLVWTAANAVEVGVFWGEAVALPGAALAAGLVMLAIAAQALRTTPLWTPRVHDAYAVGALLAMSGMVVSTLGSAYMGSRMSATEDDLGDRFKHYREGASLVHGAGNTLLGIGLGRFPDAYFWLPPADGFPGTVHLRHSPEGHYLQLGGARYTRGYGEMLRVGQRVPLNTATPFHYRLRARSDKDADLLLNICRKNLLYPDGCAAAKSVRIKGGAGWQQFEGASSGEELPASGWLPRPAFFAMGVDGPADVDVDDVEISDATLRPLLRNGDFGQGEDFWFFTSDRDHLPWHAKNLFLHVYIEQGLLGLGTLVLALGVAAVRLLKNPTRLHPLAPTLLASLAAVTVVGLVDSLLDMPRLTVFICLLLWLGLTLRIPPRA
jgi:hypothetical protein